MPRRQKKHHYIYKTTNTLTNKYYIGMHSTDNLEDGYLGSGKRLRYSIIKYGKKHHKKEILEYCDNRDKLAEKEKETLTEEILRDPLNINIMNGGEKWNTLGMITVRDKNNNCFNVFKNDPRYLSGELISAMKCKVRTKDKNGKYLCVNKDDPRYLSGELTNYMTGKSVLKDKNNNKLIVDTNDPRYVSGELVGLTNNMVLVKNKNNTCFHINKDDPRYLSGGLKPVWCGKKHKEETKHKMSETHKKNGHQVGAKNSQFGKIWIYSLKEKLSKRVLKHELEDYLNLGWFQGRKMKWLK